MPDEPFRLTGDAHSGDDLDGITVNRLVELDDRLGGYCEASDGGHDTGDLEPPPAGDILPAHVNATIATMLLLRQAAAVEGGVEHEQIALPKRIGRYEILREAGRGAFSYVFEARDDLLHRRVAVKVARPEAIVSASVRRRFIREAELAARLIHPHVVAIHEVGEHDGLVFITTEYCEAGDLSDWLDRHPGPVPARQAAEWVRSLAGAVAHAHASGIVHRDIKPANVLLAAPVPAARVACVGDAPLEDGSLTVKLSDFGLGKLFQDLDAHELTKLTRSGTRLGTPAWMAPEQIDNSLGEIGPATDIHGLGLVLDRLLTGRAMFAEQTEAEIFRAILLEEPVAADRVVRDVPRDLAAVCLKCLAKQPADRYPSAADLAADLSRFLADEPTLARPCSLISGIVRSAVRQRWLWLLAMTAVVGIVMAAWSGVARRREAQRLAAVGLERDRQEATAELRRGFDAWRTGDAAAAVTHLQACEKIDSELATSLAGRWLLVRLHGEHDVLLRPAAAAGRTPGIYAVAFAHDGSKLAAAHADGQLSILQLDGSGAAAGPPLSIAAHDEVNDVAFSPDGHHVASAGEDGRVCLWNATDGSRVRQAYVSRGPLFAVVFSPAGKLLVCGGANQELVLIPLVEGVPPRVLRPFEEPVADGLVNADADIESVQFLGEDRLVVACGRMVAVVDLSGTIQQSLSGHDGTVGQVSLSRDGTQLVSGGTDREPRIFDLVNMRLTRTLPRHPSWVQGCDFSVDGGLVATGCRDGVVRIFDVATGLEKCKIVGHLGRTWDVKYSPDGMVISAGADGTLRRWDPEVTADALGMRTVRIDGPPEPIDRIRGRRVAVGLTSVAGKRTAFLKLLDRIVMVDTDTGVVSEVASRVGVASYSLAFDSRRNRFASAPTNGPITVHFLPRSAATAEGRDVEEEIRVLPLNDAPAAGSLTWTASGGLIAGCVDGQLLEWDPALVKMRKIDHLERGVDVVRLSPHDGIRLAIAAGPLVRVYPTSPSSGRVKTLVTLPAEEGIVVRLAWSPDGQSLAFGTSQGRVSIIEAKSGKAIRQFPRHSRELVGMVWAPDGRTLVTADAECMRFSDVSTATTLDEVRPGWNIESLDFEGGDDAPTLVVAGSVAVVSGDLGREPRVGIVNFSHTLDGGLP